MAIRCARGERGAATIRDGRRTVQLTGLGGMLLWFDTDTALASAARLASAVAPAATLSAADEILRGLGVRTELAYEQDAAADTP